MNKRIKPDPIIVSDIRQAEGYLAEMAALDRKLTGIANDMNTAIDAAKERASNESAPLLARRKALGEAIGTYSTLNKGELFKERKSLDLGFGVIGFRLSTQIMQAGRVTKEMTLEKLHEYGFTDGIRTKEEINKDAVAGWPEERLALVGLRRRVQDAFFIEIKAEDLAPEV